MSLNIFEPEVSKVSKGLEGKTVLIYGTNSTGKTLNATRAEKPYYLGFEAGINAIPGIPFARIQRWADFIKINKQLTNPLTLEKAQSMYATLIFDTAKMAGIMCQQYICNKFDSETIASGNKGFGLWKEYEAEIYTQINLLTSCGYTVYFISQEGERKFNDENGEEYIKLYPAGDKRTIDPICDLVDIIGYAKVNGLNEKGEEIPSSLYLRQTKEYHARSRFPYMTPYLEVFTMENFEKAIANAIIEQEKNNTGSTVDYTQFKESQETKTLSYEELMGKIGTIAEGISSSDKVSDEEREELANEYITIVENYLGKDKKVSEASKRQTEQLELILFDLSQNEKLSKLNL